MISSQPNEKRKLNKEQLNEKAAVSILIEGRGNVNRRAFQRTKNVHFGASKTCIPARQKRAFQRVENGTLLTFLRVKITQILQSLYENVISAGKQILYTAYCTKRKQKRNKQ